jgi:hypothetical protein
LKFNEAVKRMLDHLATDLIENTRAERGVRAREPLTTFAGASRAPGGIWPQVAAENAALKKFLLARLYNHPSIVADRERSVEALANCSNFMSTIRKRCQAPTPNSRNTVRSIESCATTSPA